MESESPLRRRKEIPVIYPPEVFAVYVPSHVDRPRDLLIGEHWVFFKLRDAEWFVEKESEAEPATAGVAGEDDLRLFRESVKQLSPAIVPYQSTGKTK